MCARRDALSDALLCERCESYDDAKESEKREGESELRIHAWMHTAERVVEREGRKLNKAT